MTEEIINTALKNLQKEIPIEVKWCPNRDLDGQLKIGQQDKKLLFTTVIKNEIRHHHVDQIINQEYGQYQLMLVAERIFPNIKKKLRQQKIAYLEANGNIYIEHPDMFLLVDTNKPYQNKKEKGNRAFTKTGLKVVFHFLLDKNLVNLPQREIAEKTGVGLGNIPQVIEGLKETGYLLHLDKKKYAWENRIGLLNRWIIDYETTLRPTLIRANYQLKKPWEEIHLKTGLTAWGGEPAADILTNHLRPEKFILYTKENQASLIRNYKLVPEENGELVVFDLFWKHDTETTTAPPLLVYTELILEGGKRNKETAEKIFNEYVKPKL